MLYGSIKELGKSYFVLTMLSFTYDSFTCRYMVDDTSPNGKDVDYQIMSKVML